MGSILVTLIQLAALYRSIQKKHERIPFYLYVDEMHSFVSLSFVDVLAEARKYKLSLFLTHQYIEQIHENIRSAIFGNVGTLISFRIGATDAEHLAKEFHPVFNEDDLITLPRYSMYLKLMIDEATSAPFNATTLLPQANTNSLKEKAIEFSRKKYSSERSDVEKSIFDRHPKQAKEEDKHELFDQLP